MKYLKLFETHAEYEAYMRSDSAVRPNVSACKDQSESHFNDVINN